MSVTQEHRESQLGNIENIILKSLKLQNHQKSHRIQYINENKSPFVDVHHKAIYGCWWRVYGQISFPYKFLWNIGMPRCKMQSKEDSNPQYSHFCLWILCLCADAGNNQCTVSFYRDSRREKFCFFTFCSWEESVTADIQFQEMIQGVLHFSFTDGKILLCACNTSRH